MKESAATMPAAEARQRGMAAAGQFVDILLLTRRSVRTTLRVPAAFLPSLAISVFFLFVYDAGLGNIAKLPGFGGDYLGFILPVAIVSAAVSGAGSAGQALVRDLESRYLYKLLLTPASRAAIVLGPIIAGALELGVQVVIIIVLGVALGMRPATGLAGRRRLRAAIECGPPSHRLGPNPNTVNLGQYRYVRPDAYRPSASVASAPPSGVPWAASL